MVRSPPRAQRVWARVALLRAGAWWFQSVGWETAELPDESVRNAWLAAWALSAVAAMLVARLLEWARFASLGFVPLPVMVLFSASARRGACKPHPLETYGWLAWPLAFGIQYEFLYVHEGGYPRLAPCWHVATFLAPGVADRERDALAGGQPGRRRLAARVRRHVDRLAGVDDQDGTGDPALAACGPLALVLHVRVAGGRGRGRRGRPDRHHDLRRERRAAALSPAAQPADDSTG